MNDTVKLQSNFSRHVEEVNGVPIHYAKIGKGPVIMCVHGWTNNWMGWTWTAAELAKEFTVVTVDMVGFGDSGNMSEYTIDAQADYLAGLIEKAKLDVAGVVGLSMGSQVTAVLGKKYPELTRSVVLFGPVFVTGRLDRVRNGALGLFMRAVRSVDVATNITKFVVQTRRFGWFTAKYFYTYNFDESVVELGMEGRQKMRAKTFVDMGVSLSKFSIAEVLDDYQIPALLAFGEHDIVTSEYQARRMLSGRRGDYHFVSVPDAGHIVPAEKPESAAAEIKIFLTHTS